jgi:hypothetical protein
MEGRQMKLDTGQVEKVLSCDGDLHMSQMGLNMMLRQLRYSYHQAPNRASLEECTQVLNAYLARYSGIMDDDAHQLAEL